MSAMCGPCSRRTIAPTSFPNMTSRLSPTRSTRSSPPPIVAPNSARSTPRMCGNIIPGKPWSMNMTASSAHADNELLLDAPLPSVRGFEPQDEAAWEGFVFAQSDTSFFHRAGWRRVIENCLGHRAHYRCAWRGDTLVGILPLIEVKSRLFGHALVSLAFGVAGGIAATDPAAVTALAEDAATLGAKLGVDFVELRHETPRDIPWIAKP